jgi:hypothetical protein
MFNIVYTEIYYLPLVQFVLGGRHKELEEGHEPPRVARQQPVPEPLFHILYILDAPDELVVIVQQLVPRSIQLLHNLCHSAVVALSTMRISQLGVRTPASCARPR